MTDVKRTFEGLASIFATGRNRERQLSADAVEKVGCGQEKVATPNEGFEAPEDQAGTACTGIGMSLASLRRF